MKQITFDVNLDNMLIEELLFIEDMGKKGADGKPLNKDVSFRRLIEIMDKAVTVEGYESVGKLPVTALPLIMDAIMKEMENMSSPEGPTKTSD